MAALQKKSVRISVIIVHYKTEELTLNLLKALPSHSDTEIVLVDNSPDDGFKKKIKTRYPHIAYVDAGKNLGFAGGNNLGIKKSTGEWVFILNSDTLTSWSSIFSLVDTTADHSFLVASPRLENDGVVERNVGYFDNLFTHPVNAIFARPRMIDASTLHGTTSVDIATGAALLVHRSVFERIGMLDDKSFFMYFEDIDFCYRLHKEHIPILYVPQVIVTHYGGGSSDKDLRTKNTNYMKGLDAYLLKNRGPFIETLNRKLKLFQ